MEQGGQKTESESRMRWRQGQKKGERGDLRKTQERGERVCVYVYACVCVHTCAGERERERGGKERKEEGKGGS